MTEGNIRDCCATQYGRLHTKECPEWGKVKEVKTMVFTRRECCQVPSNHHHANDCPTILVAIRQMNSNRWAG